MSETSRESVANCPSSRRQTRQGNRSEKICSLLFTWRAMMADRSKEKAEWLRKVRDEIRPAYARLLSLGRLILQCDDGSEVAIRFTKSAFAHLCGFEYYMDSHKERRARHRISMTTSYEGILRRSVRTIHIGITTGTRHTKSGGVVQNQNWI